MSREWNPEFMDGDRLRAPNFFRAWLDSFEHTGAGIASRPIAALFLIALAALQELFPKIKLIGLLNSPLVIYLAEPIIKSTWAQLSSVSRSKLASGRYTALKMYGASLIYGLSTVLGLLFLVVPGVWCAIRGSMATTIACLHSTGPTESIRLSTSITSGNFFRIFRYSILAPLTLICGLMLCTFFLSLIGGLALSLLTPDLPEETINLMFSLPIGIVGSLFPLTLFAPMTHMYAYLLDQHTSASGEMGSTMKINRSEPS